MFVCLRVVVVVQCVGVGGRYLFSSLETESDVYGWLYFDCHWPEALAQSIDNVGALMTLVAGGVFGLAGWLMWKMPSDSRWFNVVRRFDQAAAGWVALWMLLIAAAHMMRAAVFAELSFPEHAVRYVAPMTLAICGGVGAASCSSSKRTRFAVLMLTVAAAFTFAAHGYKAYACYAPFTDLILLSDMQWTDIGFTQTTVENMLVVIGVVDILVAVALLVLRSRVAAFYMVVWGLVTAASRMTALGIEAWPETLIRIANGGVPLAIFIHWTLNRR
ncbi:putative transmembrane protein [Rhodopirellula islandica]|uniref:Transmembrane protein n=1 Tax=Rhodopirellula islandica TaxID=595434 RepID=A0A0J1BDA3_RHOIS|nr:hypothetical protein [Rhodopirellula islandica]KLU04592.1 putative transmembrane protein [Rhodopirellula islandica]